MKEIMELSAFLLIIPFFLGVSVLLLMYGDFWRKSRTLREGYLIGGIVCIGLAEMTHLISGYFGWSFSRCANTLGMVWMIGCLVFLALGGISFGLRKALGKLQAQNDKPEREIFSSAEFVVCVCLGIMLLLLAAFVFLRTDYSFYADATTETATALLQTDQFYTVNPFTGNELQMELPARYRMLCLPTIYASVAKLFGIEITTVMFRMIPVWLVMNAILAFSLVGKALWPEKRFYRLCFLLAVSILLFVTNSWVGQTGFMVFHQGFTPGALRVALLLPMTLYYLLAKKYVFVLLPIAAEGCICWTFFGTGWCFALVLIWVVAGVINRSLSRVGGDL